jgi:hypothetical protein
MHLPKIFSLKQNSIWVWDRPEKVMMEFFWNGGAGIASKSSWQ